MSVEHERVEKSRIKQAALRVILESLQLGRIKGLSADQLVEEGGMDRDLADEYEEYFREHGLLGEYDFENKVYEVHQPALEALVHHRDAGEQLEHWDELEKKARATYEEKILPWRDAFTSFTISPDLERYLIVEHPEEMEDFAENLQKLLIFGLPNANNSDYEITIDNTAGIDAESYKIRVGAQALASDKISETIVTLRERIAELPHWEPYQGPRISEPEPKQKPEEKPEEKTKEKEEKKEEDSVIPKEPEVPPKKIPEEKPQEEKQEAPQAKAEVGPLEADALRDFRSELLMFTRPVINALKDASLEEVIYLLNSDERKHELMLGPNQTQHLVDALRNSTRNAYVRGYHEEAGLKKKKGEAPSLKFGEVESYYNQARDFAGQCFQSKEIAALQEGKGHAVLDSEQWAQIDKKIFNEFVVEEHHSLFRARASEMPPREKNLLQHAWSAYTGLSRQRKLAISIGLGFAMTTGVGLAAGGAAALAYGGRRAARMAASMLTSHATNLGMAVFWKAKDKISSKKTFEYQVANLSAEQCVSRLNELTKTYRQIAEKEQVKQKRRRYINTALTLAAGLTVAAETSHAMTSDVEVPGHPPSGMASVTPEKPGRLPLMNYSEIHQTPPIAEVAQPGDSIWRLAERHLSLSEKNFDQLASAQKRNVIANLTQEIQKDPANFGLQPDHVLQPGDTIDFSHFDPDKLHGFVEHAQHLTQAQIENIDHNDKIINDWAHDHPGRPLTEADGEAGKILDNHHPEGTDQANLDVHDNQPDEYHDDAPPPPPYVETEPDSDGGITYYDLPHSEPFTAQPEFNGSTPVPLPENSVAHLPSIQQPEILLERVNPEIVGYDIGPTQWTILLRDAHVAAGDGHPFEHIIHEVQRGGVIDPDKAYSKLSSYIYEYPVARHYGPMSYEHYEAIENVRAKDFIKHIPDKDNGGVVKFSMGWRHKPVFVRPGVADMRLRDAMRHAGRINGNESVGRYIARNARVLNSR
jgi:ribosomal protein L12E/L44/L45/RPP1/RPP2